MKKKRKRIAIAGIASILTISGIVVISTNYLSSKEENTLKRDQTLAMYIEGDDGYELSTNKTFPTKGYKLNTEKSTCKNGGTISQDPVTKTLSVSVSHADQCSAYFDFDGILGRIIATSNGTKTSFNTAAMTDEGIFEMEDDYGTSYYYRGAVTNNYVKFGQNKSGQDMYWRIIRVNGDGSLRIMYTGTQPYANGTNTADMFIGEIVWNSESKDAKYIGWMYGGTKGTASTSKTQAQTNETDSDIKTMVDTWYKENIVDTGYANAVVDVLFCNDRSFASNNTGYGAGTSITYYGASRAIGNNPQPTFKCPQKNDAFTVEDTTKGNGDLTYPVGLITADEVVTAGGRGTNNDKYYLYRHYNRYWTLSPSNYYAGSSIYSVNNTGNLNGMYGSFGVAPVINLSAEYSSTLQGTGTAEDPYRA